MKLNEEQSIYLQISQMLEDNILRDVLPEETRVPSTNEFAKHYKINPATAAKGINLLVEEGLLYKKRGIGMFVAKGAKEKIEKKRRDAFYEGFVCKLVDEAKSLGITQSELAGMIARAQDAAKE